MARPVDHEKRTALALAAMDVLQAEGLNLPMAQLAQRLELKRPTLLYYFPDKASIAAVALKALLQAQAAHVLPRMGAHDHPIDQLRALLWAIHEFHRGREDRLLFLAQALAVTGQERASQLYLQGETVFEGEWEALTLRLEQAVQAGRVRPCDPRALIQLVRSINDGLFVQRATSHLSPEPTLNFLWEHMLLPLKVPTP